MHLRDSTKEEEKSMWPWWGHWGTGAHAATAPPGRIQAAQDSAVPCWDVSPEKRELFPQQNLHKIMYGGSLQELENSPFKQIQLILQQKQPNYEYVNNKIST